MTSCEDTQKYQAKLLNNLKEQGAIDAKTLEIISYGCTKILWSNQKSIKPGHRLDRLY